QQHRAPLSSFWVAVWASRRVPNAAPLMWKAHFQDGGFIMVPFKTVWHALLLSASCPGVFASNKKNIAEAESTVPMWLPAAIAGVVLLSFAVKQLGIGQSRGKQGDSDSDSSEDERKPKNDHAKRH
ncbi:unnamed protein product, partial [Prorocentrum cordatum]